MSTKVSPKTLKRKTWEAVSRFIRARDKNCITCKTQIAQHCGHYIRNGEHNQQLKGNALWYDARNLAGQCFTCNRPGRGQQDKYALYLEERYGFGILQELSTLRLTQKNWTREEIEEKRKSFVEAFNHLALRGLGTLTET